MNTTLALPGSDTGRAAVERDGGNIHDLNGDTIFFATKNNTLVKDKLGHAVGIGVCTL